MFHGYLPAILGGLGVPLGLSALSLGVACVFRLLGAAAKLSNSRAARAAAEVYTTLIRGVPELVLMLMLILAIYYGGQILLDTFVEARGWNTIDVPPFAAGTLTIGFIFGAYVTETFRGAILAVPRGQMEAAAACGLTPVRAWRRILLPQLVRHAMPGFANNWLVMVKATALVSIIGLDDMLHRANMAAAATREPFTFFVLVAAIYLAITTVSIVALSRLEKRYSLGVKAVHF